MTERKEEVSDTAGPTAWTWIITSAGTEPSALKTYPRMRGFSLMAGTKEGVVRIRGGSDG
jgi:hypothetical protein